MFISIGFCCRKAHRRFQTNLDNVTTRIQILDRRQASHFLPIFRGTVQSLIRQHQPLETVANAALCFSAADLRAARACGRDRVKNLNLMQFQAITERFPVAKS